MCLFYSLYLVIIVCIDPPVVHLPCCGVQKFIPQGRAIAGYVFPADRLNSESVPISGLTRSAGCILGWQFFSWQQPVMRISIINIK